jgi:GTP pyrophosphokinase
MDEIAEKGMQHITNIKMELPKKVAWDVWLNLLKALENSESSAVDFVEDFKMIYTQRDLHFTPKGDIKSLPKGATSLDFSIHSEIGIKLAQ